MFQSLISCVKARDVFIERSVEDQVVTDGGKADTRVPFE